MSTASASRRRPRGRALAIVLISALVLVYVVVVALYALNERAANIEGCTEEPPSDAVLLSINPESVNAANDRIVANLAVLSFGPIGSADTSLLSEPLTILVSDTDGPRSFTIAQDEIPSPQSLNFITDGYIERWPFDSHSVEVAIVSLQGEGDDLTAIPTLLCGSAHVPGWTFASEEIAGTDEVVVDGEPVTQIRVTATRSGATVAFGIVILGLMAVLPVLGLTVAIVAYRGIRKVEATLMSWMAAMCSPRFRCGRSSPAHRPSARGSTTSSCCGWSPASCSDWSSTCSRGCGGVRAASGARSTGRSGWSRQVPRGRHPFPTPAKVPPPTAGHPTAARRTDRSGAAD